MKNKQTLIGSAILVVGLLIALLVFTTINNAPGAGDGQTEQDNVSAGVGEAVPDAIGGGVAPTAPATPVTLPTP